MYNLLLKSVCVKNLFRLKKPVFLNYNKEKISVLNYPHKVIMLCVVLQVTQEVKIKMKSKINCIITGILK